MKKILLLITILPLGYFANAQCVNSDFELLSITGTGPYTITTQLCVGGGITSGVPGAANNTEAFAFGFQKDGLLYPNTLNILSFSPGSVTGPFTGDVLPGASAGGSVFLGPDVYHNAVVYEGPSLPPNTETFHCISSTAACGNGYQHCIVYTFVTNILPSRIVVFGVEASGSTTSGAGCNGSPNLVITISTLPLNFTSFNAAKQNSNVLLNWKTENEVNVNTIDLERSADGIRFTKIYSVPAKNQPVNEYSYQDNLNDITCNNAFYYRLKQTDRDGNYKYSTVVSVSCPRKSNIAISPNPASSSLSFKADNLREISMMNMFGQVVYRKNGVYASLHTIDVSYLPAGIYMLSLINSDGTKNIEKVQVAH